jgi:DnaJ-class molecular chaperone
MRIDNHYGTLGVHKQSTEREIKEAYGILAGQWHPDRNNNSEESRLKMPEINVAYNVLKDVKSRAKYDKMLGLLGGECIFCEGLGATKKRKEVVWQRCEACDGNGTYRKSI